MEDEAPPPPVDEDRGAPAWMATFADLATLLMSFFVLILSFSEMDILKYKQIAGSLSEAFGVQREVKSRESPRGINIIAKEFSPGKPQPTPLNKVKQDTTSNQKRYVKLRTPEGARGEAPKKTDNARQQAKIDAKKVRAALKEEIERGIVEVSAQDKKVVIRIREHGSFPSGAAKLMPDFRPVLEKIRSVLSTVSGQVVVGGHTDDVPISTARFRSNWELSSARAVSVVQELLRGGSLQPERFQVAGYADTKPLSSNRTVAGRGQNRRVELMIVKGSDNQGEEISAGEKDVALPEPGTMGSMQSGQTTDAVELMQANNSVLMELMRGFYPDPEVDE